MIWFCAALALRAAPSEQVIADSRPSGLSWIAREVAVTARSGRAEVKVDFETSNASDQTIAITAVRPSCGCVSFTKSRLPLVIAPQASELVELTIDVLGKRGRFRKEVNVLTSQGQDTLVAWIEIIPTSDSDRDQNQQMALGDRQRVFRGNCAECHADPIGNQTSDRLFSIACAICHQAPHRASMVPRLALTDTTKDATYWREWITHGQEGTLMPAFAHSAGGPLSDTQIESLVNYLLALPGLSAGEEQDWAQE